MGRESTGAQTTKGSQRIELGYLLKNGFIQKGQRVNGVLSWQRNGEDNGQISLESRYFPDGESYLRLSYRLSEGSQHFDLDYRIPLVEQVSNLGKGAVLYLVCPESGARCRILYRAYGSHCWKARQAYQNRLYYPIQLSSAQK